MREFSPEHRERISRAMKGKPKSAAHRAKMSENMRGKYTGPTHPNWRGEDASYNAIHAYLARNHPKSGKCEDCGTSGVTTDYALIHGRSYTRDRADYRELCRACHRKYDAPKQRKTHCKRGHELAGENLYVRPDGKGTDCLACRRLRNQARFVNPAPPRLAGDMGSVAA